MKFELKIFKGRIPESEGDICDEGVREGKKICSSEL